MCATGNASRIALLAVGLFASSASGQAPPSIEDVPPIERQVTDFYNAISTGPNIVAAWSANPARVALGSDIALTLTVRHAANPRELIRPDLRTRPEFTSQFQITDGETSTNASEVKYVYHLRPRTVGPAKVPELLYRYYRPRLPEGKRLVPTRAASLTIHVDPSPAPPRVPLEEPEEFFQLLPDEPTTSLPSWAWLVPIGGIPLVVGAWVLLCWLLFPNAAQRARMLRNRAARTALAKIRIAIRTGNVAEMVGAVRGYLVARWGLDPHAATPNEIAAALAKMERTTVREETVHFFQACDQARFGNGSDTGSSLSTQALQLVESWEGGAR